MKLLIFLVVLAAFAAGMHIDFPIKAANDVLSQKIKDTVNKELKSTKMLTEKEFTAFGIEHNHADPLQLGKLSVVHTKVRHCTGFLHICTEKYIQAYATKLTGLATAAVANATLISVETSEMQVDIELDIEIALKELIMDIDVHAHATLGALNIPSHERGHIKLVKPNAIIPIKLSVGIVTKEDTGVYYEVLKFKADDFALSYSSFSIHVKTPGLGRVLDSIIEQFKQGIAKAIGLDSALNHGLRDPVNSEFETLRNMANKMLLQYPIKFLNQD